MVIQEVCLAVDIAEDRGHTSVAAAGYDGSGRAVIELCCYLEGAGAVAVDPVLRLRQARTVTGVVLDVASPAATLLGEFRPRGVIVTEMKTKDVTIAHGKFLDGLKAGGIGYVAHPALDAAVRAAQEKPLAGWKALERRIASADESPFRAAEFAYWGLSGGVLRMNPALLVGDRVITGSASPAETAPDPEAELERQVNEGSARDQFLRQAGYGTS